MTLSGLVRRLSLGVCSNTATARVVARGFADQQRPVNPWNDFNNVAKVREQRTVAKALIRSHARHVCVSVCVLYQELRRICNDYHIRNDLPDTLLLKDLGYKDLVMAIRKKHGGFGAVATKMGIRPDAHEAQVQRKLNARANRRRKRQIRVEQHDFY
ncbi:hypothetical protein PINS_up009243 [Pythium insidiosum]|nr:hypothetical protein PINS_up009243 [Pythium insidiosum]